MRFCSATKPYGFGTILLNFFVSIDRTTKYSLSSKKKKSSLNPKQREKNFLFGKKKRNCVTPFTKALAQETRSYHIQNQNRFSFLVSLSRKESARNLGRSKESARERAKVRRSVHAAFRAHKKKGEKSTRTFSKLKFERGFVSDFLRHVCTRARIDTSFFARATSR